MMAGTAAELFRYHTWANRRLIEFCAALSDESLAATAPDAYGSVRDTLGHLVESEAYYVFALTGAWADPPLRESRRRRSAIRAQTSFGYARSADGSNGRCTAEEASLTPTITIVGGGS